MRLPRFWKDTGSWNDKVVSVSILTSLGGWCGLAYHLESLALGLASIVLGPVTGFALGICVVSVLSTYFGVERGEQLQKGDVQEEREQTR